MPSVATYSPTGDAYIDGILSGLKWGVSSLTFSFPTDPSFYGTSYGSGEPTNNFKAFTAVQEEAVRDILAMYSSVANLTFTETTETATIHGDLRYAESDSPSTAWGYYPSTSAAGGDTWYNNSTHWYDNPVQGNYAWQSIMHETGHALGLKHPQDVKGSFGAMPLDHDSLEYSVMSYRSYIGASTTSGYTNGTWSYPQTLMMYDIAALQTMYGANYTTNSGDTVYKWSPTSGEEFVNGVGQGAPGGNKIFMTLWDGGGHDTYDFSNYTTSLLVDLQPGHWTTVSATQLANLGGTHLAAGNIANALLYNNNPASLIEDAVGGSGNDTLIGNAADNMLTGGAGNDVLDGGAGADIAVFSGLQSNYSISLNADGSWTITDLRGASPDGIDKLSNIELAKFVDSTFTLGSSPPAVTNHAPVAVDDTASVKENTAIDINVLANDIDSDSDLLSIFGTPTALHGSVTVNADGTLHYLSNANYSGSDTISYTVTDGSLTDLGQVAVTVTAVNDAPVATDDTYATAKNKKLIVSAPSGVLANDYDADGNTMNDVLVGKPSHGTLKLNSDGSFMYTPSKNFVGIDTFTYKGSDGSATSNIATVTIYVGTSAGQMAGANAPQAADYFGRPMNDDLSWLSLANDDGQLHSALLEMMNDQVPMPVEQHDQLMPYADVLSHGDFLLR